MHTNSTPKVDKILVSLSLLKWTPSLATICKSSEEGWISLIRLNDVAMRLYLIDLFLSNLSIRGRAPWLLFLDSFIHICKPFYVVL